MKADLESAIAIAVEAHACQVDKGGAPYILHPLRVMFAVVGEAERIVAVLHDVCEDCPAWSFERLKALGFSAEVLESLNAVTRRHGESYEAFVARAARNQIGRAVKQADVLDNSDLSRIANPSPEDFIRLARYDAALQQLA